ncbi:hypothetical protein LOK49_LG07G01289 [Camellia lanceoleosa]|uniref:Uncharacterized protein n=1 Tax=Camellia lanceoleosa TaxID=1840588 RepID=A0ACC0HAN1_9ERIC|nr:hypothetical protein LOK49_LG07G01289 [Camellia lanceoleosa]
MLNLANLAEEVQIACRRRIKLKKGDFPDENSAMTESDIEETRCSEKSNCRSGLHCSRYSICPQIFASKARKDS